MKNSKTGLLRFISLLIIIHYSTTCSAQDDATFREVNLFVSNVCEYYAQVIICNGDSAGGILPSLGTRCPWYPYEHHDSLYQYSNVNYLEVDNSFTVFSSQSKYFCLGDENTLSSYKISYPSSSCSSPSVVVAGNTLQLDSMAGCSIINSKFAIIRKTPHTDNFLLYDTTFNSPIFTLHLNMTPLLISLVGTTGYIVGVNQNNETVLNIVNINSQQVIKDTTLDPSLSNPVLLNGNLLVSEPGDTIVSVFKYNYMSGLPEMAIAYPASGLNVASWVSDRLHFQPADDSTFNGFDRQMFIFDSNTMQLTANHNINKRLKHLVNPTGGSGFYQFINGVEDSPNSSTIYIYDNFSYTLLDSVQTAVNPKLFYSDFRCPVDVAEYDDSKVMIKVFPNPTSSSINIMASGLICGRDYKMDIADVKGKVHFEKIIQAKTTISLPMGNLSSGIYFLRIHTLKGLVTQKIIRD